MDPFEILVTATRIGLLAVGCVLAGPRTSARSCIDLAPRLRDGHQCRTSRLRQRQSRGSCSAPPRLTPPPPAVPPTSSGVAHARRGGRVHLAATPPDSPRPKRRAHDAWTERTAGPRSRVRVAHARGAVSERADRHPALRHDHLRLSRPHAGSGRDHRDRALRRAAGVRPGVPRQPGARRAPARWRPRPRMSCAMARR